MRVDVRHNIYLIAGDGIKRQLLVKHGDEIFLSARSASTPAFDPPWSSPHACAGLMPPLSPRVFTSLVAVGFSSTQTLVYRGGSSRHMQFDEEAEQEEKGSAHGGCNKSGAMRRCRTLGLREEEKPSFAFTKIRSH